VCPVGTGSSTASNVIAMATTASEKKIIRYTARASDSSSLLLTHRSSLWPPPGSPPANPEGQFHPTGRNSIHAVPFQ
jgi:hypothetical protein